MSARTVPVSPAVRVTTVAAAVVVAGVAAVVSYSHMQEVAHRAGEGWRSYLVPLSVDGLVVVASMTLLTQRRAGLPGGWLAWVGVGLGVSASLAANTAAAEHTATAQLVAAWPAVAFAIAFELLLRRSGAEPAATTEPEQVVAPPVPVAEPAASAAPPVSPAPFRSGGFGSYPPIAPVRSEPVVSVRPDPSPVVRSDPAPAVRSADRSGTARPDRSADRSATPARTGPVRKRTDKPRTDADLSRAVRELAEQTGSPPSAYALKQALGVGSGRAARLLAELDTTPAAPPTSNGAASREGSAR